MTSLSSIAHRLWGNVFLPQEDDFVQRWAIYVSGRNDQSVAKLWSAGSEKLLAAHFPSVLMSPKTVQWIARAIVLHTGRHYQCSHFVLGLYNNNCRYNTNCTDYSHILPLYCYFIQYTVYSKINSKTLASMGFISFLLFFFVSVCVFHKKCSA